MANELITMQDLNPDIKEFKNPILSDATARILNIYNDARKYAEDKNREIAMILADVAKGKAYEADGFKSVADYANQTFGIGRQNAYMLANAGKVYTDETARPELKAMSPSKLAAISSVDSKVIDKAIDEGKITADTTQAELKAFRAENTAQKAEVVSRYTAYMPTFNTLALTRDTLMEPRTIEEWDTLMKETFEDNYGYEPEIIKMKDGKDNPEDKKAVFPRRLYCNRHNAVVLWFETYVEPYTPPKKETKPKLTKEELLALLAEYDNEEDKDA